MVAKYILFVKVWTKLWGLNEMADILQTTFRWLIPMCFDSDVTKLFPKSPINNKAALVHETVWHRIDEIHLYYLILPDEIISRNIPIETLQHFTYVHTRKLQFHMKWNELLLQPIFNWNRYLNRNKLASLSRKDSNEYPFSLFINNTMGRMHKYRRLFLQRYQKLFYEMVHFSLLIKIFCHKHMACYYKLRINGPIL